MNSDLNKGPDSGGLMLAVIINGGKQFSDINPNSETEPSASKHGELSLVAGRRLHPPEGWIMV